MANGIESAVDTAVTGAVGTVGRKVSIFIRDLGGITLLARDCARNVVRRPLEVRAILYQIEELGLRSVAIAAMTAIFTGMVMALQFAIGLGKFGAMEYVGRVVALSMVRELGPVLTALMVGGRIGSGIAAEVGSMAVTEQLDAIRALGADPVKKLVLPRVLAAVLIMPLLTAMADVLGFLGAMVICGSQFGMKPGFFLHSALESVRMNDFMSGLGKAPFFGFLIALVGCYHGFITEGGTEGVGRSTTRTVVITSILILVADFFLTKLFVSL